MLKKLVVLAIGVAFAVGASARADEWGSAWRAALMGAAVGAIVGPAVVMTAFLATAVAGGVLAVIVAIRRGRLATTLAGTGKLMTAPGATRKTLESHANANRFAYGPAIAIGRPAVTEMTPMSDGYISEPATPAAERSPLMAAARPAASSF